MSSVLQTSVPLVTPCVQVLALGTENKNEKKLNLKKAVAHHFSKKFEMGAKNAIYKVTDRHGVFKT